MDEGNAPGYPLWVGWYGGIHAVKVVDKGEENENDEDDEEDSSSSEGGLTDEAASVDGKGFPYMSVSQGSFWLISKVR